MSEATTGGRPDGHTDESSNPGRIPETKNEPAESEGWSERRHSGAQTVYSARFVGFIALFGFLVAVGLVAFHPVILAASGLFLVFLLAGLIGQPAPPGEALHARYEISPRHPRPADTVTVRVTVENVSDRTFTDLRLIDQVPKQLQVVEGTPRTGAPLRPGECLSMEYEVVARRGEYTFGPVIARTRTIIGSMWAQGPVSTDAEAWMRCFVRADDIPLEEQATHYLGSLLSNTGGEGIEFFSTREYHRGDAPSRINWRELAKRGELSTITYRERQAADISVIADARAVARVSAGPGEPSGAMLSMYATYQLVTSLIDRGHNVGVAVAGVKPQTRDPFPYRRVDHGRANDQKGLVLDVLDEVDELVHGDVAHPRANRLAGTGTLQSFRGELDEGVFFDRVANVRLGEFVRDLTAWSTPDTQFICVSPLLDEALFGLCVRLKQEGFPVIVISPDVTRSFTPPSVFDFESEALPPEALEVLGRSAVDDNRNHTGDGGLKREVLERTVTIERATRIEALRQRGYTVIDWHPETPLAISCERQTLPGA